MQLVEDDGVSPIGEFSSGWNRIPFPAGTGKS